MGEVGATQVEFPRVKRIVPCAFLFSSVPSFFSAFLCCVPMPTGLAAAAPSCPQNVKISGGNFTLSHGWAPGSVLIYSCPPGHYPSPASRLCLSNGQWQTLRSTRLTKAVCKRKALEGSCSGNPASSHLRIAIQELLRVGLSMTGWSGWDSKAAFS